MSKKEVLTWRSITYSFAAGKKSPITFFQQPYGKTTAYAQYGRSASNRDPRGSDNNGSGGDSDWTNIIPTISDNRPSQHHRNSFTYTGNFVFYGLSPATEYEVIIQSKNREGWSDPNDIFKFSTRSRGEYIALITYS